MHEGPKFARGRLNTTLAGSSKLLRTGQYTVPGTVQLVIVVALATVATELAQHIAVLYYVYSMYSIASY